MRLVGTRHSARQVPFRHDVPHACLWVTSLQPSKDVSHCVFPNGQPSSPHQLLNVTADEGAENPVQVKDAYQAQCYRAAVEKVYPLAARSFVVNISRVTAGFGSSVKLARRASCMVARKFSVANGAVDQNSKL